MLIIGSRTALPMFDSISVVVGCPFSDMKRKARLRHGSCDPIYSDH